MERFSLIVVADETAPIRRFDVRRVTVRRAVWGAGITALIIPIPWLPRTTWRWRSIGRAGQMKQFPFGKKRMN